MGLSDYKFKEANFNGKKIADLSNTPSSDGMTAEDLKKYFDYIPKTMIAMGTINSIIDLLESTEGAASIGGNLTGVTGVTVQEILDSVKVLIDNRYTKENVDDLLDDKAEKSELSSLINSVSFNKTTGGFTFTTQGGTVYKFDTALEKVAVNFSYNSETQSIDLELADGTTQSIPLGDFITINEVVSSDTIQATVNDNVITLTIKDGSITDSMLSSAVMASLRELASAAQQNAEIAEAAKNNASSYSSSSKTSADNAAASEQKAEEYANTAAEKATEAANSASAAKTHETNAEDSATAAADSAAAAKAAWDSGEKAMRDIDETIETALEKAKASGEFKGEKGEKGDKGDTGEVDYTRLEDYYPKTGGDIEGNVIIKGGKLSIGQYEDNDFVKMFIGVDQTEEDIEAAKTLGIPAIMKDAEYGDLYITVKPTIMIIADEDWIYAGGGCAGISAELDGKSSGVEANEETLSLYAGDKENYNPAIEITPTTTAVRNLADPSEDGDAVPKRYVDNLTLGGGSDITTGDTIDLLLELDMVSAVTDNGLILTDENGDILLW